MKNNLKKTFREYFGESRKFRLIVMKNNLKKTFREYFGENQKFRLFLVKYQGNIRFGDILTNTYKEKNY